MAQRDAFGAGQGLITHSLFLKATQQGWKRRIPQPFDLLQVVVKPLAIAHIRQLIGAATTQHPQLHPLPRGHVHGQVNGANGVIGHPRINYIGAMLKSSANG
jgi:hypothetical protein